MGRMSDILRFNGHKKEKIMTFSAFMHTALGSFA